MSAAGRGSAGPGVSMDRFQQGPGVNRGQTSAEQGSAVTWVSNDNTGQHEAGDSWARGKAQPVGRGRGQQGLAGAGAGVGRGRGRGQQGQGSAGVTCQGQGSVRGLAREASSAEVRPSHRQLRPWPPEIYAASNSLFRP